MRQQIDCFIPYNNEAQTLATLNELKADANVHQIYLLSSSPKEKNNIDDSPILHYKNTLCSTESLRMLAEKCEAAYMLLYTKPSALQLGYHAKIGRAHV